MEGFKAQTLETKKGDGFWAFLRDNKLPLGRNYDAPNPALSVKRGCHYYFFFLNL